MAKKPKEEAKPADDDEEKDEKKKGGEEGEEGGEAAEGAEGEELPKKKIAGKKLVLFIIAGVILLAALVGGGLYFTGVIGGHPAEEEPKEEEHKEAPVYFELPLSPINLQSEGRTPSFLRLKVTLELTKEEDKQAVTDAVPRIVDSFQMYLRELSKEELQGSAGLERLREELRLRVNAAVNPVEIKDVLFTEMLFGR